MCSIAQTAAPGSAIFETPAPRQRYFILIIGVGLALWQTGVLENVSPTGITIGVMLALGLGIMMAVSSVKPDTEITKG